MTQAAGALAVLAPTSGGGGGSVTEVESTDETITVTSPTGPIVNLGGVVPISDNTIGYSVANYVDPDTGMVSRMVVIGAASGGYPFIAASSEGLPASTLPTLLIYADGEIDFRVPGRTTDDPVVISVVTDNGAALGRPIGSTLEFFNTNLGAGMVFGSADMTGNAGVYSLGFVGGPASFVTGAGIFAFQPCQANPNAVPLGGNVGDLAWDTVNMQLWFCTTAGPAGTALWRTNPITSGALGTATLASGTGAQLNTSRDVESHTPFNSAPTGAVKGTCKVELSPDNVTYSTLSTWSVPSVAADVFTFDVSVRVPAGWYLRLTVTDGTIGTTTYY
jgi:hypothetical protein